LLSFSIIDCYAGSFRNEYYADFFLHISFVIYFGNSLRVIFGHF